MKQVFNKEVEEAQKQIGGRHLGMKLVTRVFTEDKTIKENV